MVTYVINRTDINEETTNVEEKTVNQKFSIALFGRQRLEYGEEMNENLLHLLENFACPQQSGVTPAVPDMDRALPNTLQNAVDGQLWYNMSDEQLYIRRNGVWVALSTFGEVAANYGTIAHGENLPLPVSETGATFTYEECSWMVAPYEYPEGIDFMSCHTKTDDAQVVMQYMNPGDTVLTAGVANYMIVGIRGNVNQGNNPADQPVAISPTPTPAATVTPTATFGVTPTITPTGTPSVTATPPGTPSPTSTPAETPPNSVTLLGANTRLYVNPSAGGQTDGVSTYSKQNSTCGYLCGPKPDWDINTEATCIQWYYLIQNRAVERAMAITLEGISGGTPPYTVDFSGVSFAYSQPTTTFMQFAGDGTLYPIPTIDGFARYGNYHTGTNPIVTGVTDDSCTMYVRHDTGTNDFYNYDLDTVSYLGMYIKAWGVVNLKDQSGQSRNWWIQTTTPVGGTNVQTPSNPVKECTQTWSHYYDCSLCPSYCWDNIHIIGYP